MADDRRREVEVGAGLQESRLNEEFIDGLKKHGPKVIYALAAVVLVVYGVTFFERHQANQKDEAFAELDQNTALGNTSPDTLLGLADKTEGKASVALLARLNAATLLMDSARAQVKTGVAPSAATPQDMLTDAQVQEQYRKAAKELDTVIAVTKNTNKHLILQAARWSLATAKMSLGETDSAKQVMNEYVAFADAHGLPDQVTSGKRRLDTIDNPVALTIATNTQVNPALPVTQQNTQAQGIDLPRTQPEEVALTPMGNRLSREGQAALTKLLENNQIPKDWKPRGNGDYLIPLRDEETGRILTYYLKSSLESGAIDIRWLRVLDAELRGEMKKAMDLEDQILFEEGLVPKEVSKKKDKVGPQPPPASGG